MTDMHYFNDTPILSPIDDQFGIDSFAEVLANSIVGIKSPVGVSIALNGPWGSGKSSAVNLILHHLKPECENNNLEIIDFKCWWFRGEEALMLAFLQEIQSSIGEGLGEKAKKLIPNLSKILLQAGPVIGPAVNIATGGVWGAITSGSMDFTKRFFSESEGVEKLFEKLSIALEKQKKRFLIVIDDIDRLTPEEALLVFRLVKSVGRLPNVIYLLVFDRELAEKAVKEKYPSEGPHFLEKIIQASFDLPLPLRDDLNNSALSQITNLCGSIEDREQVRRFMNIFYDGISPYLNIPRDLTRLINAMTVSWPAVKGEVNIADYVALEVFRLFEPSLFNSLRVNKDHICGVRGAIGGREDPKIEIQRYLDLVPQKQQEIAERALKRLFPRLEDVGYAPDFIPQWEAQRLVCTSKHFNTYFRMSVGDDALPAEEIDLLLKHCGDIEFVKKSFREALTSIRNNNKSKVPLIFDEMNTHAGRIEKSNFANLIKAIFEIADEIDREEDHDSGMYSIGNTNLRIHWLIRRLTFERCELNERSDILMTACQNAHLIWLTDFTSSAMSNYYPREGKQAEPPEKCLVKKECLDTLKEKVLNEINTLVKNGELISHKSLSELLYRWRDFSENNGDDVNAWCNRQLDDDVAVAKFAKTFTGESFSHGLGMHGLGDRVSMRNVTASVEGLKTLMDVTRLRARLEELETKGTLDNKYEENIKVFLNAWRKKEN